MNIELKQSNNKKSLTILIHDERIKQNSHVTDLFIIDLVNNIRDPYLIECIKLSVAQLEDNADQYHNFNSKLRFILNDHPSVNDNSYGTTIDEGMMSISIKLIDNSLKAFEIVELFEITSLLNILKRRLMRNKLMR